VIQAQPEAPYGAVMKVVDAAKAAGFQKISMSVNAP
jgi:biopolymer transport protein ExbD